MRSLLGEFLSFFSFKICFTLCEHTSLCLCGCLWRPEENVESIGTGVSDVSEMSNVGVGIRIPVL